MSETAPPVYRFSPERVDDLLRLGVTKEQINEVEAVLPICAVCIAPDPPLADTRDELDRLVAALVGIGRILKPRTRPAHEALSRWQMAAHERGHPFGNNPQFATSLDLNTLVKAAKDAKTKLGGAQRRSHAADPRPIEHIARALRSGWMKGRHLGAYQVPPGTFDEVVQFAYEAMGQKRDSMPRRALREYRRRLQIEAQRRAVERNMIG